MIIIFFLPQITKNTSKTRVFRRPAAFRNQAPQKMPALHCSYTLLGCYRIGEWRTIPKGSRPPKPANSANALTIPRAYWSPFGTSGSVMANMMPRPCSMQPSRDTSASGSSPHQFVTREAKLTLIHASQISRSSGPLDLETPRRLQYSNLSKY